MGKIIELFRSTTESKKPLEVAKQCIDPEFSEKDINRYLHHLSKEGILSLTYNKGTIEDPSYSALPIIEQISGIHLSFIFLILFVVFYQVIFICSLFTGIQIIFINYIPQWGVIIEESKY